MFITMSSSSNSRRRKRGNKNKSNNTPTLKTGNPLWAHDQALLAQSFPDTQIWQNNAEHVPRFGAVNSRDNKVFNIVQSNIIRSWLTGNSAVNVGASKAFLISDLSQVSSLLSVFDQYRLMQAEVWLTPTQTYTGNTTPTTVYTALDYDDANVITNESAMLQYENVTVTIITDGVYRRFRPHQALATYSGAFTSFANVVSQWNDAASTNIQHYGFKAMITPNSLAPVFDLTIRTWYQFRNVF